MTETILVEEKTLQKKVTQMFGEYSCINMGKTDETTEGMIEWINQFTDVDGQVEQVAQEDVEQLMSTLSFDHSDLWQAIFPLSEQWVQQFKLPLERVHAFIDPYLEEVYQTAFDSYVKKFGATPLTKFLTVQTMAVMTYVAASYFAGQRTFYEPIVQLYEKGHVIIGIKENTLYVS